PARIEEVVDKVKKEMEQHLKEEGDKACFEVGVHGLHPELVKLVGRMKFRTSYGQNCLQHSKEVAWLAGMMAAEVKADVKLAKRMGLLHDIGKALTHEQEGSHPELSLQVLTKYNESAKVINAALCGHENVKAETIEAVLVEAADGISAARPGARRDVLESYIQRLAKLEEIALSYKGVEMCYAIQAGRELRVMTKADIVSDPDAHQLARDISKRIEAEMQYPGHIKLIGIREKREIVEYITRENLLLRPASFPAGTPGAGHVTIKSGPHKIAVLNLMGRVFMLPIDCPFRKADEVLPELRKETPIILVDMHCEA